MCYLRVWLSFEGAFSFYISFLWFFSDLDWRQNGFCYFCDIVAQIFDFLIMAWMNWIVEWLFYDCDDGFWWIENFKWNTAGFDYGKRKNLSTENFFCTKDTKDTKISSKLHLQGAQRWVLIEASMLQALKHPPERNLCTVLKKREKTLIRAASFCKHCRIFPQKCFEKIKSKPQKGNFLINDRPLTLISLCRIPNKKRGKKHYNKHKFSTLKQQKKTKQSETTLIFQFSHKKFNLSIKLKNKKLKKSRLKNDLSISTHHNGKKHVNCKRKTEPTRETQKIEIKRNYLDYT